MLDKVEDTRERIIEIAERLFFERGFSGTSLNDIMNAAELTKGAFFHHFRGKEELARAVIERWAANDDAVAEELVARAGSLTDDPLQEAILFVRLFEEWFNALDEPLGGCMFASYTYQSAKFDDDMHSFISAGLNKWMVPFEGVFARLLAVREPKIAGITARDLTEHFAATFEGGLVLTRALGDPGFMVRRLREFRLYLTLLFEQ